MEIKRDFSDCRRVVISDDVVDLFQSLGHHHYLVSTGPPTQVKTSGKLLSSGSAPAMRWITIKPASRVLQ